MVWTFYHYTRPKLNGVERLEHVREPLAENKVYFPRPSELNDPSDCHPPIDLPGRAQIEGYLARVGAARLPGRANRRERRWQRETTRARLSDRRYVEELSRDVSNDHGVLSLSRSKCNQHLWSEYADQGSGVCIEYSFNRIVDEGNADWLPVAVSYLETLHSYNPLDFLRGDPDEIEQFILRRFLQKTTRWRVEEEVRVFQRLGTCQKITIPPGTPSALFLGPRIGEEDVERTLDWKAGVPVFRCDPDNSGTIRSFSRLQ